MDKTQLDILISNKWIDRKAHFGVGSKQAKYKMICAKTF